MRRACSLVFILFALAYLAAIGIFLTGLYEWFGADQDPLSAVFLMPLGLPWNQLIDLAPESFRPWLALLAPLANLLFVWSLRHRYSMK